MERWKQEINAGNQYFRKHQYCEARECYTRAQVRARALYPHWHNAEEAVAAVVITDLNLVDLFLEQQRLDEAEMQLRSLYSFLCAGLANEAGGPKEEALYHGLQRCRMAMMNFCQDYSRDCGQEVSRLDNIVDLTSLRRAVKDSYHYPKEGSL